MKRRDFPSHFAATVAATLTLPTHAQQETAAVQDAWSGIESSARGRLGVAVMQADGSIDGHRLDERFPMCSTFKWLAAACVLQRVDRGQERLERRLRFGREVLLPYSPVVSQHVGAGMTIAQLCHAAI